MILKITNLDLVSMLLPDLDPKKTKQPPFAYIATVPIGTLGEMRIEIKRVAI